MRIRNFTPFDSNLASVTDLIQTPHSLYCGFGENKPLQLVGQAAEFNLSPGLSPCQSSGNFPEGPGKAVPEGNRKFRGQNQRPSSCGRSAAALSGTALAGPTGRHKHRAFSSLWQSLLLSARFTKSCCRSWQSLVILAQTAAQFDRQESFNGLQILGRKSAGRQFFFREKCIFQWK